MVRKIIIPSYGIHLPRKFKKKIKKELEKKLKENPDLQVEGAELEQSLLGSSDNSSQPKTPDSSSVDNSTETPAASESTTNQDAVSQDQLKAVVSERDEYIHDLKRLQAEFDNYRKRVLKERAELKDYLIQDILTRLLEVLSNMERALDHPVNSDDVVSYKTGVQMVYKQFMNILSEFGLTKIESVGQPFDPRYHEAVSQVETDEHEPGTILMEITPGYKINERVLTAPKVQVAAKPTSQPQN